MIDKFDLPENCAHDHVVIQMAEGGGDYPLTATPYDESQGGNYTEPESWEVTDRYRRAVNDGTDIPLFLVDLEQPETEQGGNL